MACLCAPTTHEGSFRCRLHRSPNSINNSSSSSSSQKGVCSSNNLISDQSCCVYITARESASALAPHDYFDDDRPRFSWHAAAMKQTADFDRSYARTRPSCSSSFHCTRPPPAKRSPSSTSSSSPSPSPSSSSSSKSSYLGSSSPSTPPWCASSGTTPSASHAAALAIMKQHLHNKHSRPHNRNTLSSAAASKIGPSRLSRMAVACAEELPLANKEDYCISTWPQHRGALDMSDSFAEEEAPAERGFASFQATQINLKSRSTVNKFTQGESSCRIVGSKEGSLIMPTVY